ncbi:MAG TPA: TlpA disulfide reductase family protein [Thermoanaerobaculia bacterium]|jgi:thiol-disulfide isomerase/thioredoxin|nr:TlpA disulfide reductase family protein [Thermoanaerobaculia bacterium]
MHSPEPSGGTLADRPGARLGLPARLGLLALAVCALSALFWPRGGKTFQEPGGFLFDASGQAATIGPRLAPVTLVHFWATWCPPCIQEIPALQRLSRDFSSRHGFKVLMVAVNDSNEKVRTFLGSGAEGVLFDPRWEVANRYGTDKLPETYLVVNGKVVRKFVGMTDWDDPSLRRELESRLQDSGSTAALRLPGT